MPGTVGCRPGGCRRLPAARRAEAGFTLVELLVVMIVIGILAAIAVPVFLAQRVAAVDSATKSDVTRIGQEMTAYFLDGSGPLIVGQINNNHTIRLATPSFSWQVDVEVTYGSALHSFTANATSSTWCIALVNGAGSPHPWQFSAAQGLTSGGCPP